MPEEIKDQKEQPSPPKKSNVFFSINEGASIETKRRLFLPNTNNIVNGGKVVNLNGLSNLASFLPLADTRMHSMLTGILGTKSKGTETELFMAYANHLADRTPDGRFEKNGIRYTKFNLKRDDLFACAIDVINDRTGEWENAGKLAIQHPSLSFMRQKNIEKHVVKADESYYNQPLETMVNFLVENHMAISNVDGFVSDASEAQKLVIMEKSHGNQNLVINDPSDYKKMIKMVLGGGQDAKTDLEVLANKMMEGAGCKTPKTDIINSSGGVKVMHMDNYRIKGDQLVERRQEYFLDIMRKSRHEAHDMNYQEMSKFLDLYEGTLPDDLKDPGALENNKKEIFRWAMVNSATNNTDNHGRNLAVMVDEKGRLEVSPFFDVGFDSEAKPMSTYIDGIPPIHHIDITKDEQLESLWNEMDINADFSEGLEMRDKVVSSMARLPEYAKEIGIDLFDEKRIDSVIASTSVQSKSLSKLVSTAFEEAQIQEISQARQAKVETNVEAGMP